MEDKTSLHLTRKQTNNKKWKIIHKIQENK